MKEMRDDIRLEIFSVVTENIQYLKHSGTDGAVEIAKSTCSFASDKENMAIIF